MNALAVYRLARGVRLRTQPEGEMLLVPEGVVKLNETAAATLALVDGTRDERAIAIELARSYDTEPDAVEPDVRALIAAFVERGYLVNS